MARDFHKMARELDRGGEDNAWRTQEEQRRFMEESIRASEESIRAAEEAQRMATGIEFGGYNSDPNLNPGMQNMMNNM